MCGIAGFWRMEGREPGLDGIIAGMADSLRHRGPDDQGLWQDAQTGVALAHRRLSILDLSPLGHQPMASSSGRYQLVYNGEIYNAEDLRAELLQRSCRFRGTSDTEVFVEALAVWGLEETVGRLQGMFAMALWDQEERCLHLIRDRLGIKPLYWGRFGSLLLFGSELKALRAHPGWTPAIDRPALASYLRYGYVGGEKSIYSGISKLSPGTILTIRSGGEIRERRYWSLCDAAEKGVAARAAFDLSDSEAVDGLEALLKDAVRRHMAADVPLGAFLSGGVDSSAVVALMQAQSARPVKTFSIGFHDGAYDEAEQARLVARHLGTDHTELYVTQADALRVVPDLPRWYDEPFADVSQIPTLLVSELTRRHVTVSLSGDGGDELYAGYNRHRVAAGLLPRLAAVPGPLRALASAGLGALSPAAWDRLGRLLPAARRPRQLGDKLHKLAALLSADPARPYRRIVGQWHDPAALMADGVADGDDPTLDEALIRRFPDALDRMQLLDMALYLPDDILVKLDRASMAVSLEARVPLLDHRLVEQAWSLPRHLKLRGGESKWILRQVLTRYVPRTLIDRPKMGFAVPIGDWLKAELRGWAEELLRPAVLEGAGLKAAPVLSAWRRHLAGQGAHQHALWTVLMYLAWLET